VTLSRAEQNAMAAAYERAVAGDTKALAEARELAAEIDHLILRGGQTPEGWRAQRARGGSPEGRGQGRKDRWEEWELEVLNDESLSIAVVARRTGRTRKAVSMNRQTIAKGKGD
jgi:hypothetical protein